MKKVILSAVLVAGISANLFAQGQVHIDNFGGGGLIMIQNGTNQPVADSRLDISLMLMGGSSSSNLTAIATVANVGQGAGIFYDSSAGNDGNGDWNIPGTVAGGTAFLEVIGWEGSDANLAAAIAAGEATGSTPIFSQITGGGALPVPSLSGMPNLILVSVVPEPTTLALCGLGAASLLLFRRKK